ncbi:TPA: hypothetical protein DEP21_05895 [Patescibacteria group bacterium]|nr:hypothetical protein [Candidatus Gracilibacteria bacterium]
MVTFVYPNLYEVAVYTQQNKVLTLKTIPEINQAIRDYLISKSKEYNTILKTQYTKSATYYQTNKSAFDFLDKISLATPNNRTQKYLDDDYFVKLLGDTNISNLAELLYYKNLPTYSRKQQQYVDQDLSAIRSNFDLSKKIAYVVSGYLSQHADW